MQYGAYVINKERLNKARHNQIEWGLRWAEYEKKHWDTINKYSIFVAN
jgi:hypothetical protein